MGIGAIDRDKGRNIAVIPNDDLRALGVYFRHASNINIFPDLRLSINPNEGMKGVFLKRRELRKQLLKLFKIQDLKSPIFRRAPFAISCTAFNPMIFSKNTGESPFPGLLKPTFSLVISSPVLMS